jgi:hypothetical protein
MIQVQNMCIAKQTARECLFFFRRHVVCCYQNLRLAHAAETRVYIVLQGELLRLLSTIHYFLFPAGHEVLTPISNVQLT